jgi:hypothetical protein
MSPRAKCLCLLPLAMVEVSFTFPQWPKHGGEGPRGWPEAVPMRCSSLVMVCMLGNERSGYLNFLLAERLIVRGPVGIDTPCISADAILLSPTHRSSSYPPTNNTEQYKRQNDDSRRGRYHRCRRWIMRLRRGRPSGQPGPQPPGHAH